LEKQYHVKFGCVILLKTGIDYLQIVIVRIRCDIFYTFIYNTGTWILGCLSNTIQTNNVTTQTDDMIYKFLDYQQENDAQCKAEQYCLGCV
jgi:hypothetical protein